MKIAKKLKGGADQHPINSPVFSLIRAINKITTILKATERYK